MQSLIVGKNEKWTESSLGRNTREGDNRFMTGVVLFKGSAGRFQFLCIFVSEHPKKNHSIDNRHHLQGIDSMLRVHSTRARALRTTNRTIRHGMMERGSPTMESQYVCYKSETQRHTAHDDPSTLKEKDQPHMDPSVLLCKYTASMPMICGKRRRLGLIPRGSTHREVTSSRNRRTRETCAKWYIIWRKGCDTTIRSNKHVTNPQSYCPRSQIPARRRG